MSEFLLIVVYALGLAKGLLFGWLVWRMPKLTFRHQIKVGGVAIRSLSINESGRKAMEDMKRMTL